MNVPEPYAARLKTLRAHMEARGLTALLVLRPENRRYLSGYAASDPQLDESSGCLFITRRRQVLLTDFRYAIAAAKEAPGYDVRLYTGGAAGTVAGLARKAKVKKLGFEEDLMTVRFHDQLAGEIGRDLLAPSAGLVETQRAQKDPEEIRLMTKALRITEAALARTIGMLEPGRTEIELARFLERAMLELGAEGPAFESIVAAGPNAALPHAVPGKRKVREGDPVIFDVGAMFQGYRSDMTRTMVLGRPKPWLKEIYRIVRRAQTAAIDRIRPGLKTNEADAVARRIIEEAGYGRYFGHGLGHGVGLATHEAPSLSWRAAVPLEPGMVVTVEPGIYLEGQGGVRLEQMVLITETGCRVLNRDKHLYDWSEG